MFHALASKIRLAARFSSAAFGTIVRTRFVYQLYERFF
jgi:hypothetical protein